MKCGRMHGEAEDFQTTEDETPETSEAALAVMARTQAETESGIRSNPTAARCSARWIMDWLKTVAVSACAFWGVTQLKILYRLWKSRHRHIPDPEWSEMIQAIGTMGKAVTKLAESQGTLIDRVDRLERRLPS
jgi:hypothetical protein